MTRPDGQDGDPDTLELINSELAASLQRLDDSGKSVDTKAGILAGFAATAAQFLAGQDAQLLLQSLALAAYAVAFAFAVGALAVSRYMEVPDPRQLVNGYARRSRPTTLADLVVQRVIVFEYNTGRQARKVRRWWIALGALTIGLSLSIAAVVHTGMP